MRNLIAFFTKYSFFFLFLFFEVLAFYLLFRNNHFQRSAFLNSTNKISGALYEQLSEWTDYFDLKEVNQALAEENNRLRNNQIQSFHRLFGENIRINDTIYQRKYLFTKAKVINNSIHKQNNYLTLNIGRLNGVESGMGVIGTKGVIGVVKAVSEKFSSVLSLLHRAARVSVKLQNTNYFGSMQWDGGDYRKAILEDIPNHVSIQIGDSVVTSGFSATFPEGVVVATIASFEKIEGENFYSIELDLINDFKHATHVYVVKNMDKTEQKELENQMESEDD